MRNRKAVSPVIATVILVAVAITVAVAVAYWMGGIAGQYTKFEKVEIQSAVCTKLPIGGPDYYWNVTMKLKNTGTAAATLLSVFINDIEVTEYDADAEVDAKAVANMTSGVTIGSGDVLVINIFIDYDNYLTLSSGTTVNIKIHSAGGMDYIKLVELV